MKNNKVAVLGGGGNIGWWVEKVLLESGWYVSSFSRNLNKKKRLGLESHKNFKKINYDLSRHDDKIKDLISKFDCIVDFICFDRDTAKNRINLLSKFKGIYLFVSSVAVYERKTGRNKISNQSSCELIPWKYARSKREAEKVFIEYFPQEKLKVLRLGHTYDTIFPNPIGPNDWTIIDWIMRGNPMPIHKKESSKWPILHSQDAARRILEIMNYPRNFSNILNIVAKKVYTWEEIEDTIFNTFDLKINKKYISLTELFNRVPYWYDSVFYHKIFEECYIGQEIDMFKKFENQDLTVSQGLKITKDWYLNNKNARQINEDSHILLKKLVYS